MTNAIKYKKADESFHQFLSLTSLKQELHVRQLVCKNVLCVPIHQCAYVLLAFHRGVRSPTTAAPRSTYFDSLCRPGIHQIKI